jgi:hypothetical protein
MARAILALTGLGFLGFGIAYTFWPLPMGRITEIPLPTPTARIDFAATYGGLQMGLGVFLLVCARRPVWLEPGLWAATAALAGLFLIRLQSILVISGSPTRSIWIGIAIEASGAVVNWLALRQFRRTGGLQSDP